jgi:UDP:flavonoid glycosyltransferase YjiC (YdhE family)
MRVLFTSMPVHSHVAPLLPLASAARQAGHDVVFVTGPTAIGQVESAGLCAVAGGLTFGETTQRYRQAFAAEAFVGLTPDQRLEHLMVHALIGIAAPAMAEDLVPFAQQWGPDLVISNVAEWAGEVAAAVTGVPHVMHGFGPVATSEYAAKIRAAMVRVRARWGIEAARIDSFVEEPYLDIWPEDLQPSKESWLYPNKWPVRPDNALPLPALGPLPAVLEGLPHERTVYVTAGTTHNTTPGLLETMVEAFRDERVNVIVTIGVNGDPERFGPQPKHIRIEQYVPQAALLPYCDVVVCNAGAGTVLGALAHATPLVTLPVAADQHRIAAQVAQAGAGLVCPDEPVSASAIRDAFRRISADPAYPAAAARIRRQILSMPTPADVVARLEKLAIG